MARRWRHRRGGRHLARGAGRARAGRAAPAPSRCSSRPPLGQPHPPDGEPAAGLAGVQASSSVRRRLGAGVVPVSGAQAQPACCHVQRIVIQQAVIDGGAVVRRAGGVLRRRGVPAAVPVGLRDADRAGWARAAARPTPNRSAISCSPAMRVPGGISAISAASCSAISRNRLRPMIAIVGHLGGRRLATQPTRG